MKKLLLLLALVGMIFTACEGGLDSEENGGNPSTPKIELSQQSVEVAFESAQHSVSVTSPYSWEAISKNDWIVVDTPNGIAGDEKLKFTTLRNEEEQERKGTITLKNTDYNLVAELYVTQKSFVPAITIELESLTFAVEGGTQEVAITANFDEYEYSTNADWLTIEKSESAIKVTAKANANFEERTAEITISSEKYGVSKNVSVTQKGISAESENAIFYISSNGKIVKPYKSDVFGANIVSNTYRDGQGLIIFDAPVTSIGNYAFEYCTSLKSVTIPDSVTEIGESAFEYCTSLTSIAIPDSVTSIGYKAFYGCYSLTSVTIGNSVTSIGDYAFYNCTGELIVNCNIPSASSSGIGAFYGSRFTKVTIGNSVTSIGSYAFSGCSSLTSVTIPDSVTSIGDDAFSGCDSLTSVTIPDSITSIGTNAFMGCTGELIVNCNIPSTSSSGIGAFYGSRFTKVTIGNSVTKIGDSAFQDCTSLTSITIGNSVTSIEYDAFSGCTSLTSVTIPNSVTSIADAFAGCTSLTSITIPDSVTSIGDSAFYKCTSLTSITIGKSVTSIGHNAFSGCSSLTSVTIPDSITSIGSYAFSGCTSLISIIIPNSVTSIGSYAFSDCSSLTSVTIGNSVTSIGMYAFYNCTGELIINSKIVETNYTDDNYPANPNNGWLYSAKFTKVTIGNGVTKIGDYAFYKRTSLTSVTIPDSVTSIGGCAFYWCSRLTDVYCKPTTPPAIYHSSRYQEGSFPFNEGMKIYVPRNSYDAYMQYSSYSSGNVAQTNWCKYESYIYRYDF